MLFSMTLLLGSMPTGGYGALKNRAGVMGGAAKGGGGGNTDIEKEPVKSLAPADKLYPKMVRPDRQCSPPHVIPFDTRNECLKHGG